jgi:hypothetical protein
MLSTWQNFYSKLRENYNFRRGPKNKTMATMREAVGMQLGSVVVSFLKLMFNVYLEGNNDLDYF